MTDAALAVRRRLTFSTFYRLIISDISCMKRHDCYESRNFIVNMFLCRTAFLWWRECLF